MNRMFEFSQAGKTVVIIEAKNESSARSRTQLVSHIVSIPPDCIVLAVTHGIPNDAPVFFDIFLASMEETIEEAIAEAAGFYLVPELD